MKDNLMNELINILDNDELIIDNDNEINLNVDYPYLIFSRDDLVRTINLCNKMILAKSDISEYNSISFIPVKDFKRINLCVTNELSHFTFSTEMLGSIENSINNSFSISLIVLQKIIKFMGNKVLIYKNENKYYTRLLDGDLLIDARPVNEEIVIMPGNINDKIAEIGLDNLGGLCNSILPILLSDISSSYKRVYFNGDKAYFKSPFYYIESDIKTPKMILSFRDIEFISKLYKYYKNSKILLFNVTTSLPRLRLKVDNINYQFISSNSFDNTILESMDSLMKEPEVSIDYNKLYRTISMLNSLPNSSNIIKLKYINGLLNLNITNNSGESNFNFELKKLTNRKLHEKEVTLNINIFKKIMDSFYGDDTIELALDNKGITIKNKTIKSFLLNYEV